MKTKACIFNIQKFSIHDGPGIRSVVFFKGCPLRCYWCANPESQSGKPENMWDNQKKQTTLVGEYKSIEEILEEVLKDRAFYEESDGGVTLSGGEVLYQAPFAIELLKELKHRGIHTACETTGFAQIDVFEMFSQYVDLLYFDIKHYDEKRHLSGIGVSNQLILKNLKKAAATHPNLVVRVPIIPSYNDSLDDAKRFAALFSEYGVKRVELLPFHQYGEKKYEYLNRDYRLQNVPQLHTEDLLDYQEILTASMLDCLVR
ncbi:glycyl-radical enzyme activating protein [Enterococcus sp. BWR-S5]|uniref:glycyl-radical enzyme activating protein n=1 Tax=Enterococcus sp. BWR-S5 TaxID=2787714 RepID=UPI001924FE20|nr:glycyl-radical enzyme activating protein [Enterococcus sp. BWR-S5]MBL1223775.1 glycyl-radical enzyme activating protein [Enterococcus sp. BWR-S5]